MSNFRINYPLLAKVRLAKRNMKQPADDERYYALRINFEHYGKVLEAKEATFNNRK